MQTEKFYHAAAYLRLSRDDRDLEGRKDESDSIRSQRDMICSYVKKQDNMEIYDVYIEM